MAQIIQGGAAMFDAMLYGSPKQETLNFLARQFDSVSQNLSEAGKRFYESAYDAFQQVNHDYAARMLRAAGRAVSNMWMNDCIQPLTTIGQLQHAPLSMVRWVMAEPSIRKLYQQQRVEGYSETYTDLDPGRIGPNHYDYRRATNGVLFVDDTPDAEGNYGWHATTYFDNLFETDSDLPLWQQADIQETWKAVRKLAAQGKEDPTSRFNADIG